LNCDVDSAHPGKKHNREKLGNLGILRDLAHFAGEKARVPRAKYTRKIDVVWLTKGGFSEVEQSTGCSEAGCVPIDLAGRKRG
jgi:hypothetical protein